jgi:hypothetical protein
MDIVREFFFPGTTAGKSNAYITFFSSTMESTRVNVVEWINLVNQNAQDLRDSGGQADESAELAVLQKGLLPEFKDLSLHLKNVPNLTLKMAIASIMDFARDNHWLDLSRGGGKDQGSKVYFGQADKTKERERRPPMTSAEKAKLPCHNWAKFRCSRTNCPFQHAGSGSTLDDSLKKAANNQQGATPRNFQPASSNFMQQDSYNQPAARAPHVPPASSNLMHQGTAAATDSPPTGSNHYIQSRSNRAMALFEWTSPRAPSSQPMQAATFARASMPPLPAQPSVVTAPWRVQWPSWVTKRALHTRRAAPTLAMGWCMCSSPSWCTLCVHHRVHSE